MPRPTAKKKSKKTKKSKKKKTKKKVKKKSSHNRPGRPPDAIREPIPEPIPAPVLPEESEDAEDAEEEEVVGFDLGGSANRGRSRIHALAEQMGRVFGTHTAMPMSVAPVVNIMRMPIGMIEFDFRTGGGIIIGRTNRLKGKKDTLKSTMCLRALRAAQKTCRHCKWRLVTDPTTGRVNCLCPETRFWIAKEEDYAWLPASAAIQLCYGRAPDGAEMHNIKGVGQTLALVCDPPPHLKGKRGMKRRPIPFIETFRCEPMRCVYNDTERTIDKKWAVKNGVDPSLVLLIGGRWAEQNLESVERTMLTREFDFVVIDSTSMMETREHLEDRKVGERGTPAGKQKIMGDFIKRVIAAQAEEGLAARYSPTLLTTSHYTIKGIGYGQHTHLGPTDGNIMDHGVAMDIAMKADGFTFDADKQRAVFGKFTFTIDKNHCGGMGSTKTSGQIRFWLVDTPDHPVGDSNDLATVMNYARSFGEPFISEKNRGSTKLVLHSSMIEGEHKPFRSVKSCRDFLQEHDTVYDDLRHRVLNKLIEDRAYLTVTVAEESEGS